MTLQQIDGRHLSLYDVVDGIARGAFGVVLSRYMWMRFTGPEGDAGAPFHRLHKHFNVAVNPDLEGQVFIAVDTAEAWDKYWADYWSVTTPAAIGEIAAEAERDKIEFTDRFPRPDWWPEGRTTVHT
jgi:hypothetical protein